MPTGVGTGPVALKAPDGTFRLEVGVSDSDFFYLADATGNIDAPRWVVPQLISLGCTRIDLQTETINVRNELAATTYISDLFAYLSSQRQPMTFIDPATKMPRTIESVRTQALAVYDTP